MMLRLTTLLAFALCPSPLLAQKASPPKKPVGHKQTGPVAANHYKLPTGQMLSPVGDQAFLPGLRPQAIALSPDGKLLVVAANSRKLLVLDPEHGALLREIPFALDAGGDPEPLGAAILGPASGAQVSLTGLIFSPAGTRIYLSNTLGNIKVFAVDRDSRITPLGTFSLPEARTEKRRAELPAGLAISRDGRKLYVAGNVANKLHELDAETGAHLRAWDTGVAPFDVVLSRDKAYVSNSGGRRLSPGALRAPAGAGRQVRVDPVRGIANEGSVTVIDLAANKVKPDLIVELHASAMTVSPDGEYVVVTNTGSDTLSVIETRTDTVVEKIWARRTPGDLFGAQPNAVTFHPNGKQLYVCNGTQNCVAVIKFDPKDNESMVTGLIPVGWFPGAILFDAPRQRLCVVNIKGIGAAKLLAPDEKVKLNVKDFFGTISLVPVPSVDALAAMTTTALLNTRFLRLVESMFPPRPNQPPRPVPERVGEPSVFKHVIYIIKENRTYDQVLGDMPEGNGDPELCIYGEKVTPNLHKICREFVLLDNAFCCSVQSADGHQWTDSAIANGYIERQVSSGFPRSYPGAKDNDAADALAWASSGFIWDNALAHGKSFRNYGEWMLSQANWTIRTGRRRDGPTWQDFYKDHLTGAKRTTLSSRPGIESLRAHSKLDTVGWDLNVPDVMRAAAFINELKHFEVKGGFPALSLIFLPNDHTGGTRGKNPTPAAQVADNDLAMGMIVEALSHSKFWPETCLIAIEDDPQAGFDHVSPYRTTFYVVSPYTKRRQTVSTPYNHPGVLRTIELILGLPPMNEMDASATPMTDCFTSTPDFSPFIALPNTVPLDELNPEPKKIGDATLRKDALVSASLNLDEVDRCPEDVLNQILWRAAKGSAVPYPRWAVKPFEDDDD